jgi:hypothetical protein
VTASAATRAAAVNVFSIRFPPGVEEVYRIQRRAGCGRSGLEAH